MDERVFKLLEELHFTSFHPSLDNFHIVRWTLRGTRRRKRLRNIHFSFLYQTESFRLSSFGHGNFFSSSFVRLNSLIYTNLKTCRICLFHKIHRVTCSSSLDSGSCSSAVWFFGDVKTIVDGSCLIGCVVQYSFTPFSVIGTHMSSIFTSKMFWFSLDAAWLGERHPTT